MLTVPAGEIWLLSWTAAVICSGEMLWLRIRAGSALMTTVRTLPPMGGGEERPGTAENPGRTHTLARSWSSLLERLGLLSVSWPTGRVEASKRMMIGGGVPGGISAKARFVREVTSAAAWAILVPL